MPFPTESMKEWCTECYKKAQKIRLLEEQIESLKKQLAALEEKS